MTQSLAPFVLLTPERRDAIVDDLLKKRPSKGPIPHLVTDEESYCGRYHEYRMLTVSDHEGWGYSDDELYRCGLRSEDTVRDYCIARFYNNEWDHGRWGETAGRKAGLSRKVNRLTDRLVRRVEVMMETGSQPALYAVKEGASYYGDTIGYVFGSNRDHAEQLAAAFYGHLSSEGPSKVVWAGYPTLCAYEKAVARMQKVAESTKADLERRIEKLQKKLVDDQNRAAATAMMLMQQLEDFDLAEVDPDAAAAK